MTDETEPIHRQMVAEINADPGSRLDLESKHGQVWDTSELRTDFEVLGFAAPLVVARRRSDGCGIVNVPTRPKILLQVPAGVIEAKMDGSVDVISTDPSSQWLGRTTNVLVAKNELDYF